MSDDWLREDPFADPSDPAAREREQRRREREERRRQRAAKKVEAEQKATPAPPPPPPTEEPALPPRTPEEEFWDEEPEPLESPQAPPPPDPVVASRNGGPKPPRRRPALLGRIARHPFLVFAVVAALFVLWFLNSLFQPFHGDGSGKVVVTVPKGASVSEVGDLLGEKGVIDSSTLFQVRVTLAGKRSEIYSGNFTLARDMSYGDAIEALSTPPLKRTVTVTIPEGYTRSQVAQLVEEVGIPGHYTKATVKSKYLDPAEFGGKGAKDLEGF
ncbi:MAG TPA: endolytic transglycosylase MltG, partial [Solirubrobacterales bacterium]|nr:endolytic transglycosylase MltG [Solirubrobacterales bacterium]